MQNATLSHRRFGLFFIALAAGVFAALILSSNVTAKPPKEKPGGGGGGAGPEYVVVDLGSAGQDGIWGAKKINNTGGVLVSNGGRGGPAVLMEVDAAGAVRRISKLLGPDNIEQTHASDLNDGFDVVGGAAGQATLWRVPESGPIERLELMGFPVAPGNEPLSSATGISSNGLVVGRELELDVANEVVVRTDVIVWQTDALGVAAKVALPGGIESEDVNSSGIVTGIAADVGPAIWVLQFNEDGSLGGASNPIPLPGLGGPIVDVYQISDGGRIAGTALTATGEQHGIVWTVDANGKLLDLADLGIPDRYKRSTTSGANDQGEAVGNAYRDSKIGRTISTESAPYFADNSGVTDLNKLVADFGGLQELRIAHDVNQLGWICGEAVTRTDYHAFVAIPLP